MKEELRRIYDDLSNGRLSQQDALARIRAVKLQSHDGRAGVLLLAPMWEAGGVEATDLEYAEHDVILCGLSKVNTETLARTGPHGRCLAVRGVPGSIGQAYTDCAVTCFERLKRVLHANVAGTVLVQIVVADEGERRLFAGLSALLKTAALENPRLVGQLILEPSDITTEGLAAHLRAERGHPYDAVIRHEGDRRQVLRWHEIPAGREEPAVAFRDDGVYLITGGLGRLGLLFAKEILNRTHLARVVLTGRSAANPEKQAQLRALSGEAGRVAYRSLNVGNLDQVAELVAALEQEYGRIDGVLHGAGILADNFMLKKTSDEFREVLAPKVAGTLNLDRACQDLELDFFVLFSSIAGAMGNVGQADYAAANGFLDQFAAYRNGLVAANRRHGRTRAINWPLWQAGGMNLDSARRELLLQTTGMRPMRTATGLQAFHRSLALPYDQVLVVEGDLAQMRRTLARGAIAPLSPPSTPAGGSTPRQPNVAPMSAERLAEETQDYLRRECSELLKLPSHKIEPHAAFEQYGIDSILALKLTARLEQTFGVLPKTLFFEYRSVGELTLYFVQSHRARLEALFSKSVDENGEAEVVRRPTESRSQTVAHPDSSRQPARSRSHSTPPTVVDPIAIIGLSGRYPGAVDIAAYWENLRDGRDCIVEVPKERWDWRQYFSTDRTQDGHHYSKWGGFIDGVDQFDPLFFNISPKDAKHIDPQERLFLQHAWMAIEDAGYTRASLQVPNGQDLSGQVGVYVGLMYSEYQLFAAEAGVRGERLGIAGSPASIANRVSYALNLHGPSMTLDTMCSSSLTAIHLACQDLRAGRTSLAIAGGVNVSIHPNKYLVLSAGQFISSDGHCQSFGEGGDGYIPGEGVGVVVLKGLSEARRDGDHIYGIIRGSALNHGGKTNGYTVPNPQAQTSAIGRALAESHTDARHVSYLEAHGTGTRLGDPIEIAALTKAFQQYTQDTEFCLIGSVKSNIGHCESAAGIAGLTKVLLQMQHQQIVPSLHSARLNPHIDFPGTPFVVNQTLRRWEPPVVEGRTMPRIAGISSFGAGGSNAHLIVEDCQTPPAPPMPVGEAVVVLSARTAEQLHQKARDLLGFIRGTGPIDLTAVAYTLQEGREAMEERLGFLVSSVEQLAERLHAYVAGEQAIEGAHRGQVKPHREAMAVFGSDPDLRQTIDKWLAERKLSKLLDLWVKGLELDWSRLYGEARPSRVSLPTYPFAKERYWVDKIEDRPSAAPTGGRAALHPLLHTNTSDLHRQSYDSTFSGEEWFLKDHRLEGRCVLPAAACLEMARAAAQQAMRAPTDMPFELRNVVWGPPIVVTGQKQVSIAVSPCADDQIDYEIYSREGDEEIVHSQGRAVASGRSSPARLDLQGIESRIGQDRIEPDSLYTASARTGFVHGAGFRAITGIQRGSNQVLARLRVPATAEGASGDYVLEPSLTDAALMACVGLIDGSPRSARRSPMPVALESLHVVSPCTRGMVAWARYSPGSQAADPVVKVDVDLCDEQGNVCVQMRGVSWRQEPAELAEGAPDEAATARSAATATTATAAELVRREIVFLPSAQPASMPAERKKRAAVALATPASGASAAPGSTEPVQSPPVGRRSITLSNTAAGIRLSDGSAPAVSAVRLFDEGNGVFAIRIAAAAGANRLSQEIAAQLLLALERVRQEASIKVLTISGTPRCFLRGDREEYNAGVDRNLYQAIVSFPYPVIAALQGDAIGPGFLLAALCDFMVCAEDATYGYTDVDARYYPTTAEASLFAERFGDVLADDFLYLSAPATGSQLRARGWTCPIVPAAQVEPCVQDLASALTRKPQDALRLLKQHLTRHVVPLVNGLTRVEVVAPSKEDVLNGSARPVLPSATHVAFEIAGHDVLVITFPDGHEEVAAEELVADLERVFASIRESGCYKAVVLAGGTHFLAAADEAVPEEMVLAFQRLVIESPMPIIAALTGNATGCAWLFGLLCDACVYSRTGIHAAAHLWHSRVLAEIAGAVFVQRFGPRAAREILLTGGDCCGDELQQRAVGLIVTEADDVLPAAIRVARFSSRLPGATVAAWKQHTWASRQENVGRLPFGWEAGSEQSDEAREAQAGTPTSIPLRSKVVTATAHADGIVVVTMEDRHAKNTFSDALIDGLTEAFAHVAQTPAYKVVILTGYDGCFASGGTKESLLAIQTGAARFTDVKIFQAPLDCKLPVIAAMQGHAVGAGWTLGMFADIVLMSDEGRYVSPYMEYGFTPGAGATCILADKIGHDLARESLLTARPYSGRELRDRQVRLRIMPRAEVSPAALAVARQLARIPRGRLTALKRQLTRPLHDAVEEVYRLELTMHEKTFVGRPETLARIQSAFDEGADSAPVLPGQAAIEPANAPAGREVVAAVTATLKALLADELQMREGDIDEDAEFVDLGLDSIAGVAWVRKINEKYRTTIEATKVYRHPTLAQLGRYVAAEAEQHGTLPMATPARPARPASEQSTPSTITLTPAVQKLVSRRSKASPRFAGSQALRPSQPIAIVGVAGQFPQARSVEEFWQNIAAGKDCIVQVPPERWDVNAYYQAGGPAAGKTNSRWIGALDEYDVFDPLFFNISPTEAEAMDPQQRLFLQACWHGIEDAGYDARALSGTRCGVFVGCATGDYHQLSRKHQLSAQGFTGAATSVLAARISYFLNLQGPCLSIDTACSSSLVAVAHACDSLVSGGSDVALAGGVCVMAGPDMHIRSSQAGMLSPEGRCFTFDQRADGFVPAEGVGVVMLKRLADAEGDRDIIHAVIRGWGVNQDGRTNGITAPNPESQGRLEREVYDKYQIDPGSIQLVEAHGTGTKLGDPIEVEALKESFRKYTGKKGYCALGSVKSNIGHCLTAAGIAGLIKVVMALRHRQLPPTINFERINEHIELSDSPFCVSTRLQPWESGAAQGRQAAVSAFGFSGTNAHMVVGEYMPSVDVELAVSIVGERRTAIVPLSAKTPEQLRQKAHDLLAFIRHAGDPIDLHEIAFTLQVGRAAMEERLGFVASSIEQLIEQLQAYVAGGKDIKDVYQGRAKAGKESMGIVGYDDEMKDEILERWIAQGKSVRLLKSWIEGVEPNWRKLYGDTPPRRITLPPYPFAKERYWIDPGASGNGRASDGQWDRGAGVLHPLLHRNSSDLNEQRYSSTFTGDEFFLADHLVTTNGAGGRKVMPAVAYLEMAREAIRQATPAARESMVELRDTVWGQPLVVAERTQVNVALSAKNDNEIEYEIYTPEGDKETVHCQGRAVLNGRPAPAEVNLERLKSENQDGWVDPGSVYAACAGMGVQCGPSLRGIATIHRGSDQLLAELRLPSAVGHTSNDYVLHPSVMDSALRASVALIDDGTGTPAGTRCPSALDRLRILSPCRGRMVAWVRRAPGSQAGDHAVKLDINLCDEYGNLCVQMLGLSWPVRTEEAGSQPSARESGSLIAASVWQASEAEPAAGTSDIDHAEHHVVLCDLAAVDASQLPSFLGSVRCLSLRAAGQSGVAERYSECALACFERIQVILRGEPRGKVLLQIVVGDDPEHAVLAGLAGMLTTAALENRHFVGQLILAPPHATPEELAKRLQADAACPLDAVIRYERGARQVLRWHEVPDDAQTPPIVFKDPGVYMITGGLGALGLLLASEILAQTRQASVVLVGRSPLNAEKQARLDGMSAQAGRVAYRRADVANLDEVSQLITDIENQYHRLDGIIHCAGVVADNLIVKKDNAEFSQVLAPKVSGTFNLDAATRHLRLDFFALFSSIAGARGLPRAADYAAANGFMDQFAAYRNRLVAAGQRHGRTRSIAWPVWRDGTMGVDQAVRDSLERTTGMRPMQTKTGIHAFYRSLALPYDRLLVVEGILSRIRNHYLQQPHVAEPLAVGETAAASGASGKGTGTPIGLDRLRQRLRAMVASVLGLKTPTIDVERAFVELGLDSVLGTELVNAINNEYGTRVPNSAVFDYPTVRDLALFLQQELAKLPVVSAPVPVPERDAAAPAAAGSAATLKRRLRGNGTPTGRRAASDDGIAIIGMSGRYPGADNLRRYWDNLVEGKNSIVEIPATRWDVNRYYDPDRTRKDGANSKWMGALDDIDCFDPLFFRISPHEADYIDPQHRLFLEESYKAFEDAGYAGNSLANTRCGVYLGISANEYGLLLAKNGAVAGAPVTSNHLAIAAARIAYYLNLKGPAMSVDTACSSSLVAIHLACQALVSRETDMALAGGVSLWLLPDSYVAMSQAGMFSPVGQCKTFDDAADGIVNGEGVGAVVLKRLEDARRDNDLIYAVILGSGINQDGRTNGITAPSVNSQIELEREVYGKHGIDPGSITYVEAHGTGTKLGDPIELQALATVFGEKTDRKQYCGLGSVKTNIGHTTAAAGVAGVHKVLLSLQHRTLVPSLNVTRETSRFDFANSPFYVVREKRAWGVAEGSPRRAAVSSFGFSGTNAHLVIEEYAPPEDVTAVCRDDQTVVVPLSARTPEQLKQKARDLLDWVDAARKGGHSDERASGTRPVDLAAVAYTLQLGREAMEERLGFVVTSVDQLAEKLRAYIDGAGEIDGFRRGRVESDEDGLIVIDGDDDMQEAIEKWIVRRKHLKLLELWTRGLNVDWSRLYGDTKPRRVNLPTYPFAKDRCWVDGMLRDQVQDTAFEGDGRMKSIEDIIARIGDDAIETEEAVRALRALA